METGSKEAVRSVRGGTGKRQGLVEAKVEPFVPKTDHNPRDLRSWAKRTGFVSDYSGEAGTSGSEKFEPFERRGRGSSSSPKIEIDPVLGRTRPNNRGIEIQPAPQRTENETVLALDPDGEKRVGFRGNENGDVNGGGHGVSAVAPVPEEKNEEEEVENVAPQGEVKVNLYPEGVEPVDGGGQGPSGLKCGLKENPGFG